MLNPYFLASVVLAFIASILAVYGGGEWLAGRLSEERSIYERFIGKKLRRLFLSVTPQEFIIGHGIFILVAMVMGWFVIGNWFFGMIVGAVAGVFLPSLYLDLLWNKRLKTLEEQIEECMIYMANSFKANPSLPEAMQDVVNSMPPPISQELSVMLREYKLGTSLDNALINLQRRVPSRNLQLAVSALLVGRSVGGNIPIILEDIGSTIRESFRLERVIDSQTAQGKLQAWVMGSAPAGVCGVFYVMDPELITPLFNSFYGYIVVAIAVFLNIIGVVLILKIIKIDV